MQYGSLWQWMTQFLLITCSSWLKPAAHSACSTTMCVCQLADVWWERRGGWSLRDNKADEGLRWEFTCFRVNDTGTMFLRFPEERLMLWFKMNLGSPEWNKIAFQCSGMSLPEPCGCICGFLAKTTWPVRQLNNHFDPDTEVKLSVKRITVFLS